MVWGASGLSRSASSMNATACRPCGSAWPSGDPVVCPEREDPLPAGGQVGGLRQQLVLAARQDHFRRAQHPGAVPGEAGCAPLTRGREWDGLLARPPLRRGDGLPDGGQRGVAGLVVGERAERRLSRRGVIKPDQAVERDGPVGEGAGLVEAHHVHPGQALHREGR
jgi:hypothetical protein